METLHDAWNNAVTYVEKEMRLAGEDHLVPLSTSAKGYEVKKSLAIKAGRKIIDGKVARPTPTAIVDQHSLSEVWLESKDKLLGGVVDRIVKGDRGVELIDYKTGAVTENAIGDVKTAYEVQLLLYAGLYHENYGEWPEKLTLTSLTGTRHDVPLDVPRVHHLMDEARLKLNEINALITSEMAAERLANPSPSACAFCGYRPVCKEYWKQREKNTKWPADLLGIVESVTMLGNDTLFLRLRTGEEQVAIRGLSPERFGFLMKEVHSAMFCDLRPDVTWVSFKQTYLTTAYVLDGPSPKEMRLL